MIPGMLGQRQAPCAHPRSPHQGRMKMLRPERAVSQFWDYEKQSKALVNLGTEVARVPYCYVFQIPGPMNSLYV